MINGQRPDFPKLPAPYCDEDGVWWFYDWDMGWQSAKTWDRLWKEVKPILDEGKKYGGMFIMGTGGSIGNEDTKLQDIFFNWKEEQMARQEETISLQLYRIRCI